MLKKKTGRGTPLDHTSQRWSGPPRSSGCSEAAIASPTTSKAPETHVHRGEQVAQLGRMTCAQVGRQKQHAGGVTYCQDFEELCSSVLLNRGAVRSLPVRARPRKPIDIVREMQAVMANPGTASGVHGAAKSIVLTCPGRFRAFQNRPKNHTPPGEKRK